MKVGQDSELSQTHIKSILKKDGRKGGREGEQKRKVKEIKAEKNSQNKHHTRSRIFLCLFLALFAAGFKSTILSFFHTSSGELKLGDIEGTQKPRGCCYRVWGE